MSIIAGIVPIADIKDYWPKIEDLIQKACKYSGNRSNSEDYFSFLMKGKKQLWLVKDDDIIKGVVITEIINFPRMKGCRINICTGKGLWEWGHLYTMVESFARDNGCKQMYLIARPGMEKLLKDYRKTHVLLEKNL